MARRHRGESQCFSYYDSNLSLGARVLRRMSESAGRSLVAAGVAIAIEDATGKLIAFQKLEQRQPTGDAVVVKRTLPTMAVISRSEVEALAGRSFKGGENEAGVYGPPGKSRTKGLSEEARMLRMAWGLPGEDLVELAEAKLRAFTPRHLQAAAI